MTALQHFHSFLLRIYNSNKFNLFLIAEASAQARLFRQAEKNQVPLSMAKGNVELMRIGSKHSQMGKARIK